MNQEEIEKFLDKKSRKIILNECQKVLKHSLLGGAWHGERIFEKLGIPCDEELNSDISKAVIAQMKIYCLILHFENLLWGSGATESRLALASSMMNILGKCAANKEPVFYDEKQSFNPPSVREADLFNRGMDHVLERLKCVIATCPKSKLHKTISELADSFKNIEPDSFDHYKM